MKPLFTLHAGEYLVGAFIESHFKRLNVWITTYDRSCGPGRVPMNERSQTRDTRNLLVSTVEFQSTKKP